MEQRIALATTKDFSSVHKHGIIGPNAISKAATLFPAMISDKYVMLFTSQHDMPSSAVFAAEFDSLDQIARPGEDYWHKFHDSREDRVLFWPM